MADGDDELDLDGGGEEAEGSSKKKKGAGLGGLLPNLLKFVAIGLGALVFIVTVAVITFNVLNKGGKGQTAVAEASTAYQGQRPEYQSNNPFSIRTRTRDVTAYSVSVELVIGYTLNDNTAQAELGARREEVHDYLRNFFASKYAEELKPENEGRLKQEILEGLNTRILTRSQVRIITFRNLDVMEM
ncbi:flagellar basal body protein FliL [Spirochaetia bacterium]|nr:flagellar basal body protein FliL [Spirochaetia bacterium]